MQKTYPDTEINDRYPISLDAEIFVPIDLRWRKKYYGSVIKRRTLAFFLDIVLTGLPLFIFQFIIGYIMLLIFSKNLTRDNIWGILFIIFVSTTFLSLVIIAFMESSKRKGTYGKRIMKIEITDNYGNSISFWRSLWRNFLKLLTFYLFFTAIGFILQIITYIITKKLFHDYFSSTIIGERL